MPVFDGQKKKKKKKKKKNDISRYFLQYIVTFYILHRKKTQYLTKMNVKKKQQFTVNCGNQSFAVAI